MGIIESSRIVQRTGIALTWTGDEGVLVDETRGMVHVVNGTAARAWELCGNAATTDDLLRTMADEYRVPESELGGDLESLLQSFRELELIELNPLT